MGTTMAASAPPLDGPSGLPIADTATNPSTFTADLLASLVVFLVALPLCMGVAIASGMPAERGIVTGIIGGIVVGAISGSPLQVSGPAAGLAVMTWELVQSQGMVGLAVVLTLAGLVQIAAGMLHLGGWFRATSPAVIQGMLAGIGVLIFAGQFHVLFDLGPKGGGLANLAAIPASLSAGLSSGFSGTTGQAFVIGAASLITLVAWNQFKPAKLKTVPGALLAVLVGSGIAAVTGWQVKYVAVPANLMDALAFPGGDFLTLLQKPLLWGEALEVALIASAETLLCAVAVDRMHGGPRTRFDKELFAQGVGNTLCGLVGALPMTGVIVRSSANIDAGGKTRMSTMLHGGWLLGMVALLPFVLQRIPVSSLAAVLVVTGVKLVWTDAPRKLLEESRAELAVFVLTLVTIVGKDLLTGVMLGVVLSIGLLVHRFANLQILTKHEEHQYVMYLAGNATFLRLPQLSRAMARVPRTATLRLLLDQLDYLDPAAAEVIEDWRKEAQRAGGRLVVDEADLAGRRRRAGKLPNMEGALRDAADNA